MRYSKAVLHLRALKARCGIFFVSGNHDHGYQHEELDKWILLYESMNITSLRDENVLINAKCENKPPGFYLIGVDDYSRKGNISKAINGIDRNFPNVLSAHQPKHAHDAKKNKIDFMISGHTHGGNFWPISIAVALANTFWKGYYKDGDLQIYVSQGINMWGFQARLGSRREITHITLTSEI